MQTQLLCTFSNTRRLRKTVDTIVDAYDVIFNKIFVLEDVDNTLHDLAVKRKKLIESGVPEEDKEIRELDALIEVV